MDPESLRYPELLNVIAAHRIPGRTDSVAFLRWFLSNILRLDDSMADDCICDGPNDKGIDAIYIDDNAETIHVFQSRTIQKQTRTLGDVPLKEFDGTLGQLTCKEQIEALERDTTNPDLQKLLKGIADQNVVEKGYKVRGHFITNAEGDTSAQTYLQTHSQIELYGRERIAEQFVDPTRGRRSFAEADIALSGASVLEHSTQNGVKVIVAPVQVTELLKLEGIDSQELFSDNVRGPLGKTKVNKAIADSVQDTASHRNFLLFHNGLVITCTNVEVRDDSLRLEGYAVVNGCQSLTIFFENQRRLTPELRVLVKVVKLPIDSPLLEVITHNSNNQNPVKPRDFKANSDTQVRLQNEFRALEPADHFYRVKPGESSDLEVIENQLAGQLLLAWDLEQPESAHQIYKVFGELHDDIFARPQVTARHIRALYKLFRAVEGKLDQLDNKYFARYGLSRFFILYVLRRAVDSEEEARAFSEQPEDFLDVEGGEGVLAAIGSILDDLMIDLNDEARELSETGSFDFKSLLKSKDSVGRLATAVVSGYKKQVRRGRVASFASALNLPTPLR